MRRRNDLNTWCFILTAIASLYTALARADADVYVRLNGFSPASVSISPGEVVWFTVADDFGPYCIASPTGAWTPWYLYDYGDSFGIRFNERGDYPYYDQFTWNQGIIHVGTGGGGNLPPTLFIDSPTDGSIFTAPASFDFAVTATDPENGLTQVEFYVGADLIDTLYWGPFTTSVRSPSPTRRRSA